jgi:tellurite resistance protein TehA-like permease
LAVSSVLLATSMDQPYRLEMNFLALFMWLVGGVQYVWIMTLVFYRYAFFRLAARDFVPSYWINMGAMAISTLAGSWLIQSAPHAPLFTSLLPFLEGFTLLYWATATWWIPLLLCLEIWRHVRQRVPFEYDPSYWGAVFPLGMYAACTWEMQRALDLGFLAGLARAFLYISLIAWAVTFLGMLRAVTRGLR